MNTVMNLYADAYCRYVLESGSEGDYEKYRNALKDMTTLRADLDEMQKKMFDNGEIPTKDSYTGILRKYLKKVNKLASLLQFNEREVIRRHHADFEYESASALTTSTNVKTRESIMLMGKWYEMYEELHGQLSDMTKQTQRSIGTFIKIMQYLFGEPINTQLKDLSDEAELDHDNASSAYLAQVSVAIAEYDNSTDKYKEIQDIFANFKQTNDELINDKVKRKMDAGVDSLDREGALEQVMVEVSPLSSGSIEGLVENVTKAFVAFNRTKDALANTISMKEHQEELQKRMVNAQTKAGAIDLKSAASMRQLMERYNKFSPNLLLFDPFTNKPASEMAAKELSSTVGNDLLSDWETYSEIHALFKEFERDFWIYFR